MPFEFTGVPPALLDSTGDANTPKGFKSFSQTSSARLASGNATPTPSANGFAHFRPSSSFGCGFSTPTTPPPSQFSFGHASAFGSKAPATGASPFARNASFPTSFGLPVAFGSASPLRVSTPELESEPKGSRFQTSAALFSKFSKSANPTDANLWANQGSIPTPESTSTPEDRANEEPEEQEQDSLLTRALKRSAKGRPAIFGRAELAADNVLRDVFAIHQAEAPALLAELRDFGTSAPRMAALIHTLFENEIKLKDPKANLAPVKTRLWKGNFEEEEKEDWRTPKTEKFVVPRDHGTILSLEKKLQSQFLKMKQVKGKEAAGVLAEYILDRFLRRSTLEPLRDELSQLLELEGNKDAKVELRNILTFMQGRVRWADKNFTPPPASHDEQPKTADQADEVPEVPETTTGSSTVVTQDSSQGFRFLDLPAELRNWVYREHLAPMGYICLYTRDWHGVNHTHPEDSTDIASGADISILSTNRQIHSEAKSILYRENNLCCVGLISTSFQPIIDIHTLPNSALPLLASLTLICDHRPSENQGQNWYQRVNWMQLQSMTTLKNIRICIVEREEQRDENAYKKFILQNIIERVPQDCEVSFGPKESYEQDTIDETIEQSDDRAADNRARWGPAFNVDATLLEKLAKGVMAKKGTKNGHTRDYRFAEKPVTKTLKQLIEEGVVDPSIVLGGSGSQ
ncbi:uncharacterized protein MYCFIDRAFT_84851 [Pseudocercospora fijiensis CIRAD86]|uniref:Uncharacterized protein n=1 Tax=Pseudocercospora fijiensis (strain CIRAD86) TaxID=383855 RepID=M3AKV3_PSEFD|nr:uncharacterized protein MYCFIDRAFT_84851 [Pseudocercospora fijiensis CIRAD86]EME77753.1 hypothetical protein MYCFIDRAFT_84851 [Pseudocercospora fijiensis CIRAD86]